MTAAPGQPQPPEDHPGNRDFRYSDGGEPPRPGHPGQGDPTSGWGHPEEGHRYMPATIRVLEVMSRVEGMLIASIAELAEESGVEVGEVFEVLNPYLAKGTVSLETVGDQIFVYPHASGQIGAGEATEFPPNLWSRLRERLPATAAYGVWVLVRDMERVGWALEVRPAHAIQGLGPVARPPLFGVYVRNQVIPALIFPEPDVLTGPEGLLSTYEAAGASSVAVVCREGALDETVTAVRTWALDKDYTPEISAVVLEEPRYDPLIVRCDDGSVAADSETFDA